MIEGDIDEKAYNSDLCVQRYFQRRRTNVIKDALGAGDGDVVLDIGCGSGVQLRALEIKNPKLLIGIDFNKNALIYAKNKMKDNCEFLIADAQQLPFNDQTINKIICAEIIEHLNEPEKLISETKRVLNNDGCIVITTPNEQSIWGIYEFFWDVFGRGRNYGETHLKFYAIKELRSYFHSFIQDKTITLFFVSPFFALLNNKSLLEIGKSIDRFFERINLGVIIVFRATK